MSTRRRHRSRSASLERPPRGVSEITEKDYFLKHNEFQLWLKEEKDKYFTELSGEQSRSYFRKFVKSWNRGRLDKKYYEGTDQTAASSSTSYKWAFASSDKVSEKDIRGARDAVREATNNARGDLRPIQGPTLPPSDSRASDRQYEREQEEERRQIEQKFSRKKARAEENDRIEDAVGPREVGRERMLENKRAKREGDRAFREKDGEPDIDADTLMGGDSFQARLAQRDATRKRFEDKRRSEREAKEQASRDRVDHMRQKDKATMEMFKALAQERFGS